MAKKPPIPIAEPLSQEKAKEFFDMFDKAIFNFEGTIDELEQAIGMYVVGRHYGWKVLVLVHNKRTIRKFEDIMGTPIRELFEEEGPGARRSIGYRIASTLSNFWKAVSGETPVPDRRKVAKG